MRHSSRPDGLALFRRLRAMPVFAALFVLSAAALALPGSSGTARAAVCGGNGQPICTTFSASKSSTKPSCAPGTFPNIWDNTCYSCPSGYNRSAAPITASNACSRAGYTAYKKPRYTGRTYCKQKNIFGGCDLWNWVCRDGFQQGTSGRCYNCDGYNRNANPIDSPRGCDKAFPESHARATKVRVAGCPSGYFPDPRNGGECWSCPSGTRRTGAPVTASDACVAITHCQGGMLEVRGSCYRKGECGGLNQRPCLVAERIPSCRDGYTESIRTNKCVATPPGKSPFLTTLAELGEITGKAGGDAKTYCLKVSGDGIQRGAQLQGASSFSKIVGASSRCQQYIASGFACSVPSLLEVFNIDPSENVFKQLEIDFNKRMRIPPCGLIETGDAFGTAYLRSMCSALSLMFPPELYTTSTCIWKAFARPDFRAAISAKFAPGERPICTMVGQVSFEAAKLYLIDRIVRGVIKPKAKAKIEELQAKWNSRAGVKWDASLARSIERQNKAINGLFTALKIYGGFTLSNNVLKIVNSIPECNGGTMTAKPPGAKPPGASPPARQVAMVATSGSRAIVAPGTLYTVTAKGDLLYYHHNAHGRFDVTGKKIGTGWLGLRQLTAAEGGVLYAVNNAGDLLYFEHDPAGNWKIAGKKIGQGWKDAVHVFAARKGVLYAVMKNGELRYFQHTPSFAWTISGRLIGTGWGGFTRVISGGTNAIYAQTNDGKLRYYYHDDRFRWVHANEVIGTGWNFRYLASGGNGELYGVTAGGELKFYRHDSGRHFVAGSGDVIGSGWAAPGPYGLIAAAR